MNVEHERPEVDPHDIPEVRAKDKRIRFGRRDDPQDTSLPPMPQGEELER